MKTTDKKLFISHEEAKHICDKNQYGEASFVELIKLNIRLLYCRLSRAYTKRNTKLTKAMGDPQVQTICAADKELMKKELQKKMN
ncbi:hypothetical protein [Aquimarina sp. 2201CG5-10]|uniref:hypothetical protein n=1 Tax=Aquimarina callyspongiae TaxID=3098150 RepID=UPI002AB473F7|nr:hypothetical protein [Aquimarina sp. 2201CG5-10]MDY8134493.1 hypothetical protein [Aquimarina sp. 2201CG5-10]